MSSKELVAACACRPRIGSRCANECNKHERQSLLRSAPYIVGAYTCSIVVSSRGKEAVQGKLIYFAPSCASNGSRVKVAGMPWAPSSGKKRASCSESVVNRSCHLECHLEEAQASTRNNGTVWPRSGSLLRRAAGCWVSATWAHLDRVRRTILHHLMRWNSGKDPWVAGCLAADRAASAGNCAPQL